MTKKTALEISCKPPGTIVVIDGKQWCVGEKIISKNPRSQWNKSKKQNKKNMKIYNYLILLTIFMISASFVIMILAFMVLPATKSNFLLISTVNLMGYLGAFCYYDLYLKTKNKSF